MQLGLHTDEKVRSEWKSEAYKRREDAPEMVKSLAYQLKKQKLFPALSDEYSSVHISGAARVNGRLLRNALISAAKNMCATLIKGDAILVREGNHITGVTVNDETILAEKVIVTAGAWANEILNPWELIS